jgi:hypothetical protein
MTEIRIRKERTERTANAPSRVLRPIAGRGAAWRLPLSAAGAGARNPAWDFQFIVRKPEVGKPYSVRARLALKPWQSNHDASNELERWNLSHLQE